MREKLLRRRIGLAIALVLSIADIAAAQAISSRLSAAQAQQDVDVARKALEEAHGAPQGTRNTSGHRDREEDRGHAPRSRRGTQSRD